jgi:murein DD-endopeptidase MepM/ murein hydrolase activator NlpD
MRRLAVLAPLLFLLAACGSNQGYIPRETPPEAPGLPARNPYRGGDTAAVPAGAETAGSFSTSRNLQVVEGGRYTVQRGDTVYGISRQFEVPLRSVIDANGLQPPYTLRVGQELRIPRQRIHTVEPGNTVYGISRAYGVDLSELVRLNDIAAPYTIAVGQRLVLPTTTGAQAAAAPAPQPLDAEEPAPAPEAAPEQATASAPQAAPQPVPAAIPTPQARSGGKFLWPLEGKLISVYGPTSDGLHNDGINIEAPAGAPVVAAENGVVAYAGNELRGFGNLLLIKHADGWVTAYAHTDRFLVERGQNVSRGQEIATVGSSGSVDRPQLHFEIRKGSRAIDPREMLGPQATAR